MLRTTALRFSRSTSPTSSDSTSEARAAVSYSSRHSAFSRTATSVRRHSRSSCGYRIAGPVGWLASTIDTDRDIDSQPAAAPAERDERPGGRDVPVPRCRRAVAPRVLHRAVQRAGIERRDRARSTEVRREAVQRRRVRAATRDGKIGPREERLDRSADRSHRLFSAATGASRTRHRRECVREDRTGRTDAQQQRGSPAPAGGDVARNSSFPAIPPMPPPASRFDGTRTRFLPETPKRTGHHVLARTRNLRRDTAGSCDYDRVMQRESAEREAARRNSDSAQTADRWFAREKAGEWSVVKVAGLAGPSVAPLTCSIEAKPRPQQPDDPPANVWASWAGP